MRSIVKCLLLVIIMSFFSNCKKVENTKAENWIKLFNGKDLTGWKAKINGYELGNNYNNTFKVENEAIKVSYVKYDTFTDQFGHLFYKTPFTNYKFRLQYRFIGEQVKGGQSWATKNSGIMIHCQSPESMLLNQGFPISLEVQLLGGINENESRPSGNLCTPGTHVTIDETVITEHCIQAKCKTYYGEDWITAEIRVNNDSITHFIDGIPVISYSKPIIGGEFLDSASKEIQDKQGQALTGGYISLQSESHPIEFRNIEILEL